LKRTSFNYGKDRRLELWFYGSKIGDFRRAPFPVESAKGLNLRIERVAPRLGDPQDIIATKWLNGIDEVQAVRLHHSLGIRPNGAC
jgi:hypothetical protein